MRDRIVSILGEDGYREIRISRTLLGRLRFVAENEEGRREIVVNPATGAILRDYSKVSTSVIPEDSSNSGSSVPAGSGGVLDDGDDYGSDDDGDDDHGGGDEDDDDDGSDDSGSDDDDDGGSDDDD